MARLSDFDHVPYDQNNEISKALGNLIKQRTDVSGGICFSLCCQWIELHRSYHGMGGGEKYRIACVISRINDLMSDQVFFYRAMNSQAKYVANASADSLGVKNEVGQKYGIVFESAKKCVSEYYIDREINRTHTYSQISFSIGKNGRHAICAYKSGGKFLGLGSHLYVFDPNFGEFRVKGSEIVYFFQTLFQEYGDRISEIVAYRVGF